MHYLSFSPRIGHSPIFLGGVHQLNATQHGEVDVEFMAVIVATANHLPQSSQGLVKSSVIESLFALALEYKACSD